MTHRLATKYAKNYCNRTPIVEVIVENVVTCFFGTQYSFLRNNFVSRYERITVLCIAVERMLGLTENTCSARSSVDS